MLELLLKFDETTSKNYKSNSQKIRVMSESWLDENGYCVKCGAKLIQHKNNKPVSDFYCSNCKEDYELKSKNGSSEKIVGGAYATMVQKINNSEVPNFFYLNYNQSFEVENLIIIPKHYFTIDIIEQRKPLSNTAKRAGWIGCNINLKSIPKSGRIYIIQNTLIIDKCKVIEQFNKTAFLRETINNDIKGWTLDIMKCIELLDKKVFSIAEIYEFEEYLKTKHQDNNNIKAKIRQQLQFLRDKDYIIFLGNGEYKVK